MKKKAYTVLEILVVVTAFVILLAITVPPTLKERRIRKAEAAEKAKVLEKTQVVEEPPTDYGNGIYYFTQTGREYAKALSYFLEHHQNLEVSSSAPDVERRERNNSIGLTNRGGFNWEYGAAVGYTVTFKEKSPQELR